MKRPGDTTPEPPGGRAAERLRMFENARHVPGSPDSSTLPDETVTKRRKPAAAKAPRGAPTKKHHKKRGRREKHNRPKR
jgi:hypothetical protein